jgi:class 3 adenylate cyclase
VTGGRLEVTALGDEVNEGARLQQAARDGQVLVSKSLVERLSIGDAAKLGIDPDRISYRAVAELPSVDDKTVRDAGTIAVAPLPA